MYMHSLNTISSIWVAETEAAVSTLLLHYCPSFARTISEIGIFTGNNKHMQEFQIFYCFKVLVRLEWTKNDSIVLLYYDKLVLLLLVLHLLFPKRIAFSLSLLTILSKGFQISFSEIMKGPPSYVRNLQENVFHLF